jgi:hypothetical protein
LTSRVTGSAGLGGTSGVVGTATCLKPGFGSTRGVLGRDGEPIDGVPMTFSPFRPPPTGSVPLAGEGECGGGVGVGSTGERWLLSLRYNSPLRRSFALGTIGLGVTGAGFWATDFSDTTVSNMVLGVPAFFSAPNF